MKTLTALDLNSNRINNLLDPSVAQDAATKNYVDTRPALPGGSSGQLQYNSADTALGGISQATYDGSSITFQAGTGISPRFILADPSVSTKKAIFDLSGITAANTRTITVPDGACTIVRPDTGASNNFLTAISATGVISKAQPAFTNLSGSASTAQGGLPTGGTVGQSLIKNSGTNYDCTWGLLIKKNSSTTTQSGFASETYLTGSLISMSAGAWAQGGQYRCSFDIAKTGGTAALSIAVKIGTFGTISDTTRLTFTWGAGTAVSDQGHIDIYVTWRTVGSGTSAILVGQAVLVHNLTTTGLASSIWVGAPVISSGFDSTTPTSMGITVNGGSSFGGTIGLVQTTYIQ